MPASCHLMKNENRHLFMIYEKDLHEFVTRIYCLQAAAGNVLSDSDMNTKQSVNKTDDKGGEAKYTNHTLDEVASMVHATVSAFDTKVELLHVLQF